MNEPAVPEQPALSKQEAARLIAERFLENASAGDNAANDDLVETILNEGRRRRPRT
jgi:hypothetical protein